MEKQELFFKLKHGPEQLKAAEELLNNPNLSAEELYEIAKSSILLRNEAVERLIEKVKENISEKHFLKNIKDFPAISDKLKKSIEQLLSKITSCG